MSVKTYKLQCGHCGYKRISDGTDVKDLREVPTSDIQRGIPKLDPQGKKTISTEFAQPATVIQGVTMPPAIKQQKKFKCPKCGFVLHLKQIQLVEYENDEQSDRITGSETSSEGSALPGELA